MGLLIPSVAVALGALASTVSAHGHVQGISADGVYYGGFSFDYYYEKENTGTFTQSVGWWAEDIDNGFISPSAYNTSDIVCHLNAQPANLTATVKAGGTVEFFWTTWGHPGPVLTYVALCPGECTDPTMDKTALEWVKIDEGGYSSTAETWAAYDLAANNNTWAVTVPETLASGNYVFRHEIIAVHGAENVDGAQNYPQCVNIQVTGGGSASPAGTLGEELYTETDPGIYFNPYTTITDYVIPGPALMAGGVEQAVVPTAEASGAAVSTLSVGSGAGAAAATGSAAAAATTSAAAVVSSSSAAAAAQPTTLVASGAVAASPSSTVAAASTSVAVAAAETSEASTCSKKRRRHARELAL